MSKDRILDEKIFAEKMAEMEAKPYEDWENDPTTVIATLIFTFVFLLILGCSVMVLLYRRKK